MLIFDDESENDWNRQKVLERLAQVTSAGRRAAADGPTTARSGRSTGTRCTSTNPKYDVMELKSLEDWTLEKQFKSVPNVVDVAASAAPRASTRCASIRTS
jgi:cobalt-zinc-cadmium resistance protein CzcA